MIININWCGRRRVAAFWNPADSATITHTEQGVTAAQITLSLNVKMYVSDVEFICSSQLSAIDYNLAQIATSIGHMLIIHPRPSLGAFAYRYTFTLVNIVRA
jgi:hypothetical protein